MGALPEDEFAAVDDVLLEEDNTKTVKAAMSKLGMSNLKDELLTQLKLGHAVTMPKEHLAKFVATRAKWYRSLGAPLHIDAYDKWICWPIGCVKAKCGINNAYNLQRAKEEYRKIRAKTNHGYISLGGGMVNHYRHWNKLAGFEEAMPEGNHFRCDTGFGPGRLSCYNRQCKTNVGALKCITRSTSFKGSGVRDARLPAGYVMTGGGLYNHYRHWNKRAGFEETRPNGNAWRGDMGFGWGHYTVYVRGCKAPKGHKLTCVTRQSGRGNYNRVACPRNYAVTSCGVNNHYRSWNSKSGYESHFPASSTECHCDTAFGAGDNTCYARCCKLN